METKMSIRAILKKLYVGTQSAFYKDLKKKLLKEKRSFIITANPEIVMKAKQDEEIQAMLMDPSVDTVADGIGIVKAYEMLRLGSIHRIPGVEIVDQLFIYAHEYEKSICILGAQQAVLDALQVTLKEKYPNVVVKAAIHGYVEDKDKIMEDFKDLHPDIILVALGVPAQERLIYRHYQKFSHGIFVGIGGSLDVLSGTKKRAPKFFVKFNLEWLYRICKEPSRLKRFYDNNIRFIKEVRKER